MLKRAIAGKTIEEYCLWLQHNEMSQGTIYKYRYYLNQLEQFMDGAAVTKERVMVWKETLRRNLSPVTVNGALAAVNGFFRYLGWNDCLVKFIKVKQQVFCSGQKELKREEYLQLVEACAPQESAYRSFPILRLPQWKNRLSRWTAKERSGLSSSPGSCAGFLRSMRRKEKYSPAPSL